MPKPSQRVSSLNPFPLISLLSLVTTQRASHSCQQPYPGPTLPQVHWNFCPVIDGLPTSSNPFPSILPPLCTLMGKTGCPPRTMLPIKPPQVTSHCSGISESGSRVSSFLTSLHGFQTISSPAVLQHFCGSESQAIWCTFFQPSSNFLLALPHLFAT